MEWIKIDAHQKQEPQRHLLGKLCFEVQDGRYWVTREIDEQEDQDFQKEVYEYLFNERDTSVSLEENLKRLEDKFNIIFIVKDLNPIPENLRMYIPKRDIALKIKKAS